MSVLPNHTLADPGRQVGMADVNLPKFASAVFELQRKNASLPEMFDGIPHLLRDIARENTVVVVTASAKAEVQQVLNKASVRDCVSCILDGRRAGDKNEKIQWARNRFGRGRENTCMAGDVRSDVRAGKRAAVITVAVTWAISPGRRWRSNHRTMSSTRRRSCRPFLASTQALLEWFG